MKHWRKIGSQAEDASGSRIWVHLYIPEKADPALWREIARQFLKDEIPGLAAVPSSGTAQVRTGRIPDSPYQHFFKRFLPRNRLEYIKQVFRKSRAYRDLKGSAIAESRGLNVPDIDCVIEMRKWGVTVGGSIITREVEGAVALRKWLEKLQENGDTLTRRQLMRQLGAEMARWHRAGMRHGDARDSNILCRIQKNPEDSGAAAKEIFDFTWLDNERSRPVFRKRDLIRNLVQLNMTRSGVTTTDRMRFWEAYWAGAATVYNPRTRESVLRQVIAKTGKRWQQRGWL